MQYFGEGRWAKQTFLQQSTKLNISVIGISCHFDKGESPPPTAKPWASKARGELKSEITNESMYIRGIIGGKSGTATAELWPRKTTLQAR